jgi:hypothetical protein
MVPKEKIITTKYNIILFIVILFFETIKSILEYKEEQDIIIDKLFNYDFFIGVVVVIVLFVASSTVGVLVIRSFWERFISQIFQIRILTINEAVSIMLVLWIVSIN